MITIGNGRMLHNKCDKDLLILVEASRWRLLDVNLLYLETDCCLSKTTCLGWPYSKRQPDISFYLLPVCILHV